MFRDIDPLKIRALHHRYLEDSALLKEDGAQEKDDVFRVIAENHKYNILLWETEDQARRVNVSDTLIAQNKRDIDKYNQNRNDAIEQIDEIILSRIPIDHYFAEDAWINSETAGSIIDRMSINSLKCFHMHKQVLREDADDEHKASCSGKLKQLTMQGDNLAYCLDNLLKSIIEGRGFYRIYRQFKMYNNPKLNPYLYSQKGDKSSNF